MTEAESQYLSAEELSALLAEKVMPPEEWYHYTTITGLKGILDRAQLWGTHIAYLNDSREVEYGLEALAKLVKMQADEMPEFQANDDGTHSYFPMTSLWSATDQDMLRRKDILKHELGPFVACLSRSRDQLSQWRGYGRGGGYAIHFDRDMLKSTIQQVNQDGQPVPNAPKPDIEWVAYAWFNFRKQIIAAVDEHLSEVTSLVEVPGMTEEEVAAMYEEPERKFFDKVLYLAARMKHPKFQEEWETRIMCRCDETFYSESPTLGLIPRTSFAFDPAAIVEIIVGPSDYAQSRKRSVERYLSRQERYSHVKVEVSKIPYREI